MSKPIDIVGTLLLASSGNWVTSHASKFLPVPLNQAEIGYIITASKGVEDRSYIQQHITVRNQLGWNLQEIDIAGMNKADLRRAFTNKDVIYVEGGNTFYLMKAIRESGFESVLLDLLEKGVVYIGTSAGSYVCCPTIDAATWKHQDKYDHYGVTELQGMGLVPFLISAHYEPQFKEAIREGMKKAKHPVRILTDEQALFVKNGNIALVGSGEEVKL